MDSFLARLPPSRAQIARYLIVGIITTALYLGSMLAFESLNPTLGTFWVVSWSFSIALAFNFFAHRMFTFSSPAISLRASITKYLLASLGNYGAQVLIVSAFHDLLNWELILAATLASGFGVVGGYLTSSVWVFRRVPK